MIDSEYKTNFSFFESKNYDKSPTNISNSFTKSKDMAQIDLDQPEIL